MADIAGALKNIVPQRFLPAFKKTVYTIRGAYYSGSDFACPFCNGTFRQMLPFGLTTSVLRDKEVIGGGYRENCVCPKCTSSDRERMIYLF